MRIAYGGLAVLAAGSVLAADPLPAPSTLGPEDAVRIALENHPLLQASAHERRAAEADRALARSGFLPRLDVTEELARSTNPVFVFASKLGQERFAAADFDVATLNEPDALTNAATRVSLRQNIWDAGRTRLGSRAASLGLQAVEEVTRRTEDEVAFGALAAFWDRVLAEEMLDVTRDAEIAAEANLSLATELVDAGLAVPSDRMAAESRLAEVRAGRIRAAQGVDVARAALLRALGLDPPLDVDLTPPEEPPARLEIGLDERVREALQTRPDLLALEGRIRQARVGVKLARSYRLPEIGGSAHYEWNGDTLLGSDGSNWTVGVGLRVPVFDGLETRARTARAQADLARLEALRDSLLQAVRLQVHSSWAELRSAEQRLAVADAALSSADEALRIVRERYGEGLAVMVELLAAEAAHTQARSNRVLARGDLWLARAALDLASGSRPLVTHGPGDVDEPENER